jgi:hypothetical protein
MNDGREAIGGVRLCGAWGRQAQRPCRRPVTPGRNRCRLHGGRNPGPPLGSKNGLIHGGYTREAEAAKRGRAAAARQARSKVSEAIDAADAALAAAAGPRKRRRTKPPADGGS